MHEHASRIHPENVVALLEPEPGDGDAQTRSTAKPATLHASPESTSAPFPSQEPPVNIIIDKLFVTPMSWVLAVPIVLLDHLLSPDPSEVRSWDEMHYLCEAVSCPPD